MRRLLIGAVYVAAVVAGCSIGYVATEDVRAKAAFVSRMQALEEPETTHLYGTVRGVDKKTSSLQIEIMNPYSGNAETLLLEVTTAPETTMLLLDPIWGDLSETPTAPSAGSTSFDAFTPGTPVSVIVERTPGPLQANTILILRL